MRNKSVQLVGVILVGLLLTSCNGETTPSGNAPLVGENLEVNETSVSEDNVAEPIYINNCGNPASVKQASQHSQAIMIGGGAKLGVSSGVVSGSVEGKYSSTKNVSKSITVEAAPNTNMKFILLWTEKVSEGTVTGTDQSGQVTYSVTVPISVEQLSAQNLGCPTSTPEFFVLTPTSTLTPSPNTLTPTITLTSPPVYKCDTANEQPPYGAAIKRGQKFKIGFTLVNTGNSVWPEETELRLAGNPYGTVDVPSALNKVPRLQPRATIDVGPFDAKAPDQVGFYVVSFTLGDGSCKPYISFNVVK